MDISKIFSSSSYFNLVVVLDLFFGFSNTFVSPLTKSITRPLISMYQIFKLERKIVHILNRKRVVLKNKWMGFRFTN